RLSINKSNPRPRGRKPSPFRPWVEELEGRRLPAVFVVTNTNDSGAGSLRQAILTANQTPGLDTIQFNVVPDQFGNVTINVPTPLPTVSDAVVIDGTSEPGWHGIFNVFVVDSGSMPVWDGLVLGADGCTVKGLKFKSFVVGIDVESGRNTVENCD